MRFVDGDFEALLAPPWKGSNLPVSGPYSDRPVGCLLCLGDGVVPRWHVLEVGQVREDVLDGKRAKSIVHRATINEYLADRAINAGTVEGLTLADLLADNADALDHSYVEVPPDATIEEAMDAMSGQEGCQDVFVTENGVVLGWITNVMFIEE